MNWYLAKIVFRIISGNGNHQPQFDEQLRLIQAPDMRIAFEKARNIGKAENCSFLNHRYQTVRWQFVDVCELYQVNSLEDGAELYSRISETDNAEEYIDMVKRKAMYIKAENPVEYALP
jgi:hypothetical protein